MNLVIFSHSLLSDWNHGNAHFLRGIVGELKRRGHQVMVYEPHDGWSLQNLLATRGLEAVEEFHRYYPSLTTHFYHPQTDDARALTAGADVVIVHEWTDPAWVAAVGEARSKGDFLLLFHDTHHRSVSAPEEIGRFDLRHYDGVLAYGQVISDIYRKNGWAENVWTWHEAADTSLFNPPAAPVAGEGDLVWIGNWGDEERTEELMQYLIRPVADLGLRATVYGVRYPEEGIRALEQAGIRYGGYLPNYRVPEVFARYRVTVHVPRRYYTTILPGIPTIRPFEALACGIPLISAPWSDTEGLFQAGSDLLQVQSGQEMRDALLSVLGDAELAARLRRTGRMRIEQQHTCTHRVDQLLNIIHELRSRPASAEASNGRFSSTTTTP